MPSVQRTIKAVICSHNNRGTRRKIEQIPRSLVAPLRGAGGLQKSPTNCLIFFCIEHSLPSKENPPAPRRGATRLRRFRSILSPASSVVMRAYYSFDFSYFRNLHPAFSYPFIPACFMMYFACWIAAGNCLEDDNGDQKATKLAPTYPVARIWGCPRVDLKIQWISSLSPRLQKSSKLVPKPSKTM